MSMLYNDVQMDHKQPGCKSFEIDAFTIKKSTTDYHHGINGQAHHLF